MLLKSPSPCCLSVCLFISPYAQSIMSKWLQLFVVCHHFTAAADCLFCPTEQCTGWLDGVLQQSSNVIMANIDRNQEPLLLTTDTKPATCGLWTGVCTASWNEASSQRFLCERAWQLGNAQHTKKRQKESCRKRISCDILKKAKTIYFIPNFVSI